MSNQHINQLNSEFRKLLFDFDNLRNSINALDSPSSVQKTIQSFIKERVDFITSDILDLTDVLSQAEELEDDSEIINLLSKLIGR